MMTENRVLAAAERMRAALASGQKIDGSGPIEADLTALEADQNLTFTEWFAFQEAQARAHATGVLPTDEAQTVYVALGGEAMPPRPAGLRTLTSPSRSRSRP